MSICGSWKCFPAWVGVPWCLCKQMARRCSKVASILADSSSDFRDDLEKASLWHYAPSIFTRRDFADLHNNYSRLLLFIFFVLTPFAIFLSCVGIFFLEFAKSRRRLMQIFWIKNTFTHRMTHRPKFGWFFPWYSILSTFPASENWPKKKKIPSRMDLFYKIALKQLSTLFLHNHVSWTHTSLNFSSNQAWCLQVVSLPRRLIFKNINKSHEFLAQLFPLKLRFSMLLFSSALLNLLKSEPAASATRVLIFDQET